MRSALAVVSVFFTACAVGGMGGDDDFGTDAATQKDSAQQFTQKDSSTQPDVGTTVQDSGNTTQDSGTTKVDSGTTTGCAFTGVLATYDFTSEPGGQTSTSPTGSAPGIVASPIARSAALKSADGTGSINASNWSLGDLDATRFFTLSLTPPSGCSVSITSVAVDSTTSTSGPASAAFATSADAFASPTSMSPNTPSTVTSSATSAKPLELRFYGYGATSWYGTMRFRNQLVVTGSVK